MRHFWELLFLPGFLCNPENPLIIGQERLVAWDGSCVLIPCQIKATYKTNAINITSLVWYFQPRYEVDDFTGTMLYNGTKMRKQHTDKASPSFQGRVRFVGDLGNRNCGLKISRLKTNDSGTYGARLYALLVTKDKQENIVFKPEKWFREVAVDVKETPVKPDITTNPIVITEDVSTTVTCSVPYHCSDKPLSLTLTGLGSRQSTGTYANGAITVTLMRVPTWTDHRKWLRCSLRSPSGSLISENTLELDVKYAPKLLMLEATPATVVQEGMRLSLECRINSSNPASSYRWYKNNVEIYGSQELQFLQATEEQSGSYRCEAQNLFGTVTEELTIEVQYPPKKPEVKILTQARIEEGILVTLQCSSRGNPPITDYIWYKRRLPEACGSGEQLQFANIQPEDSGQYYCEARNPLNQSTSAEVTLNVLYAPKNVRLATQSHLPIKEGDTVTLNCSVGSSNPSTRTYKWYKNGSLRERGHMWTFPAPAERDTVYRCEACNTIACTRSAPITVDVHFVPKDVRVVLAPEGPIDEGSRVDLRCAVRMANPAEVTYTWYKGRQQWQPSSAANTWTFSKVAPADSGDYSCEAWNSAGLARSSQIKLDVHYGPRDVRVSLSTDPVDVTEGVTIQLKCQGEANPIGHYYQWYWNGEEIPQTYQNLPLRRIRVEQSGIYQCRMTNAVSAADSQPLHLTVFYSRATIMKRTLIGLAIALSLLILLGFLAYSLRRRKKEMSPGPGGRTRRSQAFFVNKVKKQKLCNNRSAEERARCSLGVVNQGAEDAVSYAAIEFPSRFSKDRTQYACIKQPRVAMAPSDETVVYSILKKPGLPAKDDTKHDYENVGSKEEELHYSSLVNLTPRPRPTYPELETDSESEESIQYASLKH